MIYKTVITGASSGIGHATAIELAKEGHSLILNARREQPLNDIAELCKAEGASNVSVATGDVNEQCTIDKITDEVIKIDGELVLVNNAGFADFGAFHETQIDRAAKMVDVMLTGTMRACHGLLPLMLEAEKGTIVNVLSISATVEFPGAAAYCASKAGALMFSRVLAKEYRQKGIRVMSVLPGSTNTAIWDDMDAHPPREEMLPVKAVAETIRDMINAPRDRAIDEVIVTPPKGIL